MGRNWKEEAETDIHLGSICYGGERKECWQNEAENEHGLLGADQSSGSQKLNDPIKFWVLLETLVNVSSVVTADRFYFN